MKPILTKTGSLPNLPWQERPADCCLLYTSDAADEL